MVWNRGILSLINWLSWDTFHNYVTYYSAIVILQGPADPSNRSAVPRSAVVTDVVTVNIQVIRVGENNFISTWRNRILNKKCEVPTWKISKSSRKISRTFGDRRGVIDEGDALGY